MLVQPDGTMYMVIETNGATIVSKKLADGSVDASYGKNGYSVPVPVMGSHGALQADGKMIIAGNVGNPNGTALNPTDFAVTRLNTDGSLDKTFNATGIHITDLGLEEAINAVVIQPDGKIVAAGYRLEPEYGAFYTILLTRYNTDGSLDNTFDEDGIVETNFGGLQSANSIVLQNDGKILVGGWISDNVNSSGKPATIRYNSDGSLDTGFNGTGFQLIDLPGMNGFSNSIAIQNDGKIITAGFLSDGNTSDFAVIRLNTDGSIDSTFDGDGIQTINFGGDAQVNSIALQADGKIILAGYAQDASNYNFAVARYNTDGSPDNTFDGDGKLITDFGTSADYASSVAIQGDGKLVAIGYTTNATNTDVAVARYNTDGSLDNTFDSDGLFVEHTNQGNTHYTSTVVQADGKIIAAGYTWNGSNYDFALARYNTDGSLDNSFSGDGIQITDFGTTDDIAVALALQNDGKIIVAGTAGSHLALARYNTDGNPDNTFDGDGLVTADFGFANEVTSVALQSDGKILVGGTSALARYNSNGTLDLSFDGDGILSAPFNSGSSFNCGALTVQSDDKIVIINDMDDIFIIARYNTDGTKDSTFGTNGESYVFDSDPYHHGKSVKVGNDGKIVAGGYYFYADKGGTSSQFAVVRLNPDGSFDETFNGNGLVYTSPAYLNYGTSLVIQNDNKIILAGYSYSGSNNNFTIVRYNIDGTPDNTFSGDGIEITEASTANNQIGGIALANDSLYAAGYGQYPGNLGVLARYLLASGGPLAVTFTDFTAELKNKSVLLQWQTATEQNVLHFIIERSGNGNNFVAISNVAAKGNSSTKVNYSTFDKLPLIGINYYRLKIVDQDGKFKYSKIVSVNISNQLIPLKIFPNPASDILFVQASGNNEIATFKIEDAMGRTVKGAELTLNGNTSFTVDINNLPKGVYNFVLFKNKKTEVREFIKK